MLEDVTGMSDSSDSSKPRPKAAAVPHYTVGEEIMNSVTHGVGCLLGIAGLVLLIVFAALRGGGPAHMAAAIVYGASIILEYLASTLYHAIQPARAKRVFRIIDHSCIYLLIAGSYTPFCLITLANDGGMTIFLTTHLMEEADALCDRVAILHLGRVAAAGTPAELKAALGRPDATLEDVFAHHTGHELDLGGDYREISRHRRTIARLR